MVASKKTQKNKHHKNHKKHHKKHTYRRRQRRSGGGLLDSFLSGVKAINPFSKKEEEVWTIPEEKYNIKNIPVGNVNEVSGAAAMKWSNRPTTNVPQWKQNPLMNTQMYGGKNSENHEAENVWTIPEKRYGINSIPVGNANNKESSNMSWLNKPASQNNRFSPIPVNVEEEREMSMNFKPIPMNISPSPPTERIHLERRKKTRKQKWRT
jgi:hypothetical protein